MTDTGFNFCGESSSAMRPLDPDDIRPAWSQIADRIREAIAGGTWRQGQQLPGTGPISRHFRVSHSTVHRAVLLLSDEGVVRSVRTVGTFVRGGRS